ncbi:MAG: hypothetical protein ABJA67_01245 [Chthonomonadales bacterium]
MKFRPAVFSIPALAMLSGCGALAFLVPDQHPRDPLKLNDVPMELVVAPATGTASIEKTFPSFKNLSNPPVNPHSFEVNQPVKPGFVVTAPAGTPLPDTITVSNIQFAITATDTDGRIVTIPPSVLPANITLTHGVGNAYSFTGPEPIFHISPADHTSQLLSLLTGGGDNTIKAKLSFNLVSTPSLPAGTVLTLRFDEGTSTVKF